jgi:hypothetical protein
VRASSGSATAVRASSRRAAAEGMLSCPLRHPLTRCVGVVCVDAAVTRDGAVGVAAQSLKLRRRHSCCLRRRHSFCLRSGCCQLCRCQP